MKTAEISFDQAGLVPAIVQDRATGEVLMLAYMNRDSLNRTIESGETWFWSRSRQKLWHKGETSGNTQRVCSIRLDCDSDALVLIVEPNGPACHTGARSCFQNAVYESADHQAPPKLGTVLGDLYSTVVTREKERPHGSYTTYLFEKGLDKILKKLGEESSETIIAAKNDDHKEMINEVADLLYHLIVLLVARHISLEEIAAELRRRASK